jgi:hypothetical protein
VWAVDSVAAMSGVLAAALAAPAVDPSRLNWTAAALSWILAVPLFFVTKFVTVIAHEGGHATVGKLLFQRVLSITFKRDGGGETRFATPIPWLFDVLLTAAGYLGPSMFGLLAAEMLVHGWTDMVLWGSLLFLFAMLLAVRGIIGWIIVPSLMVVIGYIAVKVEAPLRLLYTHMWVWFLLIAPVEDMLIFLGAKGYTSDTSDIAVLRNLTLLPRELWTLVFLAGTITALVFGARLLLLPAT